MPYSVYMCKYIYTYICLVMCIPRTYSGIDLTLLVDILSHTYKHAHTHTHKRTHARLRNTTTRTRTPHTTQIRNTAALSVSSHSPFLSLSLPHNITRVLSLSPPPPHSSKLGHYLTLLLNTHNLSLSLSHTPTLKLLSLSHTHTTHSSKTDNNLPLHIHPPTRKRQTHLTLTSCSPPPPLQHTLSHTHIYTHSQRRARLLWGGYD